MKKFLVFSLLVLGVCIVLVVIKEHKSTKNLISNNSDSKTSKYQTSESVQTASEKTTSESQPAAYSSEKITSESQYTLEDFLRDNDSLEEIKHIEDDTGLTTDGFYCECVGNIIFMRGAINIELNADSVEESKDVFADGFIRSSESLIEVIRYLEEESGLNGITMEVTITDKSGKELFNKQFNRDGVIQ